MASDEIVDINIYTLQLLKEMCPDMEEIQMTNVANDLIKRAAAEVDKRGKERKLARKKRLEAKRKLQQTTDSNAMEESGTSARPFERDDSPSVTANQYYPHEKLSVQPGDHRGYGNQQNQTSNGCYSNIRPSGNYMGYGSNGNYYNGNWNCFANSCAPNFSTKQGFPSSYVSMPPNHYSKRKRQISGGNLNNKRMRS